MTDLDWSTPAGLAAIREHLAARIDGWRQPVAYAVALSPASSSPERSTGARRTGPSARVRRPGMVEAVATMIRFGGWIGAIVGTRVNKVLNVK